MAIGEASLPQWSQRTGFFERVMEPSVALQRTESSGGLLFQAVTAGVKGAAAELPAGLA
jgi:hypothetical protein